MKLYTIPELEEQIAHIDELLMEDFLGELAGLPSRGAEYNESLYQQRKTITYMIDQQRRPQNG